MKQTIKYLTIMFIFFIFVGLSSAAFNPRDNIDMKDYYNVTNLNWIEDFDGVNANFTGEIRVPQFNEIYYIDDGDFDTFKTVVEGGSNRQVIVSAGDYNWTSTVVPVSNITIKCAGGRSTHFKSKDSLDTQMLIFNGSNEGLFIEGCYFDGNSGGQSTELEGTLYIYNATDITFKDNYFYDMKGDQVRIWVGGYGVEDFDTEANVNVINNYFENTNDGTYGKCLGLNNGMGFLIEGNIFKSCAKQGTHSGGTTGLIITNNRYYDNGDEAIFLNYDTRDAIIQGNYIHGGASEGGIIIGIATDTIIDSNYIYGTNRGIVVSGYVTGDSNRTIISNNMLDTVSRQAIGEDTENNYTHNVLVIGNLIYNSGGGVNKPAIVFRNATKISVLSNRIYDSSLNVMSAGIQILNVEDAIISDNYIHGGKGYGIESSGDNVVISNNMLNDVFNFGSNRIAIYIGGDNALIDGNKVVNTEYGIAITGANASLIGNMFETSTAWLNGTEPTDLTKIANTWNGDGIDDNLKGLLEVADLSSSGYVNGTTIYQNSNAVLDVASSWSGDLSGTGLSPTVDDDSHNHTDPTLESLSWIKLQTYPNACPADTFLTAINDTTTCTSISDVYVLNTGDNMTGALWIGNSQNQTLLNVSKLGTGAGTVVDIVNDGTGTGLSVDQNGGGNGIYVSQATTSAWTVNTETPKWGIFSKVTGSDGNAYKADVNSNSIGLFIDSEASSNPGIDIAMVDGTKEAIQLTTGDLDMNSNDIKSAGSLSMTGNIDLNDNNISNLNTIHSATNITTTILQATNLESNLDGTGYNITVSSILGNVFGGLYGTWNGSSNYYLKSNPFSYYNLTNPQTETDPLWTGNQSSYATYSNSSSTFVNVAGDTMTGNLNMSDNNITDVADLFVSTIHGGSDINIEDNLDATGYNITLDTLTVTDYGLVEDDIPTLSSTWDNSMDADRLTGLDYLNNEITLQGENISGGTIAEARLPSSIYTIALNGSKIDIGTVADARIASTITRDSELSSATVNRSAFWDTLDSPTDITTLGTIGSATSITSSAFVGPLTGNSDTATALKTARTIGGVSFDGTANIVPNTITVADTADTTSYIGIWESATGDIAPKTDAGITYNAGTGMLTATGFTGPLIGNADTATTATALATNPIDCAAGSAPTSINTTGDFSGCTAYYETSTDSFVYNTGDTMTGALNIKTDTNVTQLNINKTELGAGTVVDIQNKGTGTGMSIDQDGSGNALLINQATSTGWAINIETLKWGLFSKVTGSNGNAYKADVNGNSIGLLIDSEASSNPGIDVSMIDGTKEAIQLTTGDLDMNSNDIKAIGSLTTSIGQGIDNTTGYWLCTDNVCGATCQVNISEGLIVGCT